MLGLDIQSDVIRAMAIERKRDYFFITWYKSFFIKKKFSYWQALEEALTEVFLEKNKAVALSLPLNHSRLASLSLPKGLTDEEIQKEVARDIQVNFINEEISFAIDFIKHAKKNSSFMEIDYVAAKKEVVEQYLKSLQLAGLTVKIVDIDIFALKRAIDLLIPPLNAHYLVLHLVAERALLFGVNNNKIIFYQHWIATEEDELYQALATKFDLYVKNFPNEANIELVIASTHPFIKKNRLFTSFAGQIHLPLLSNHQIINRTNRDEQKEIPLDYLLAFGLGMREEPIW